MTKKIDIDVAGKASYKLSNLTSLPSFLYVHHLNFISIENICGSYFLSYTHSTMLYWLTKTKTRNIF